jgi:septum formation protein
MRMQTNKGTPQLILASASPRRAELLRKMGLAHSVVPAQVRELEAPDADPVVAVEHNARIKAEWVANRSPQGALVLGSDTVVCLDQKTLNKPVDLCEARAMLHRLSGRTHTVYTGVALVGTQLNEVAHVQAQVTFKQLTSDVIEQYFALVNPLDKAGAYGIQQGRDLIIESVEGSVDCVMGLPTEYLEARLKGLGVWPALQLEPC